MPIPLIVRSAVQVGRFLLGRATRFGDTGLRPLRAPRRLPGDVVTRPPRTPGGARPRTPGRPSPGRRPPLLRPGRRPGPSARPRTDPRGRRPLRNPGNLRPQRPLTPRQRDLLLREPLPQTQPQTQPQREPVRPRPRPRERTRDRDGDDSKVVPVGRAVRVARRSGAVGQALWPRMIAAALPQNSAKRILKRGPGPAARARTALRRDFTVP